MKKIVCYCSGGMGNRLRPLASCYHYAKITGRELVIFWENVIPNGCLAKWNELFQNQIKQISLEELKHLDDCAMYVDESLANREASRGLPSLKYLTDKFGALGRYNISLNNNRTNIVFYCNNFIQLFTTEENSKFLKSLIPIESITRNIERYKTELNLNKSIIGVHMRGTDFGGSFSFYRDKIYDILNVNRNQKFFVCSDDLEWEEKILYIYPNNIIRRKKDTYIKKKFENLPWQDFNSFEITREHAQEGVEDMFLLSKTSLEIYNPDSTFAQIATLL